MRKFVFADEAGDFEFARKQNVSKYFIICTITLENCDVGRSLLDLRRSLIWERYHIKDYFHCCEDKQIVRDRVFELIRESNLTIEATILEKSKAQPQTRLSNARFYQYAWYYHLKGIYRSLLGINFMGEMTDPERELVFTTASVGTKRQQAAFTASVNDVSSSTCERAHGLPISARPWRTRVYKSRTTALGRFRGNGSVETLGRMI